MKKDITKIRPVRKRGGSSLPIKGKELVDDLYARIFLASPSGGGKSTTIYHLLKHTIDRRTTVVIFSSTVEIDPTYVAIVKNLKRRKINVFTFPSIWEDGVNLLEQFTLSIEQPIEEEKEDEEKEEVKVIPPIIRTDDDVQEEKEIKKEKKIVYHDRVPEYVIILDDLNKETLRSNFVVNTIKKSRHFKARVIISSQALIHLSPDAYSQLTDLYLWGGYSQDYIRRLWNRLNDNITFEQLWEMYLFATRKKYSFLNINLIEGKYRIKFDKKFLK